MPRAEKVGSSSELEVFAAAVHGAVMLGNAIGLLYNLRRRNWKWVAIHGLGIYFHAKATRDHARSAADQSLIGGRAHNGRGR